MYLILNYINKCCKDTAVDRAGAEAGEEQLASVPQQQP